MASAYMCSILHGGSCFGTIPSFEMAFVLEPFHPSRWLSFGIIPSFEVALQISGGIRAFYFKSVSPLPSSCFSGGWVFLKVSPSFLCKVVPGFHCFDVTKSLGGRLQYCAKASPPPLQSCSEDIGSVYFVLVEGFLAVTHFWDHQYLGILVSETHFRFWPKVFWLRLMF